MFIMHLCLCINTSSISKSDAVIYMNARTVNSRVIKAQELKFYCNSLHIQWWEIFCGPLEDLSRRATASWDCQWMATNHANNKQ